MNKAEIVRSIRGERRRTLGLLGTVEPGRFDTPTALPRWRVREVAAHLVTTDRGSVTGTILPALLGGVARIEAWNERQVPKWASRPVPELLQGLDRWGRRFARLAGVAPSPLYRMPLRTPWGPAAGMAMWARAYDEWVHRQDIRRALELADDQVDLDEVVEFLLIAAGHQTLRRLGARPGAVDLSLTGAAVPEWRIDLAGKRYGPSETGARFGNGTVARIVGPAPTFIMAAAGRDRFDDLRSKGVLKVEGDQALGGEFLSGLLVV